MALPNVRKPSQTDVETNIITNLADRPNAAGMSAEDLKIAFDQGSTNVKDYLQNVLTTDIDENFTTVDNAISNINSTITSIQNSMLSFNQIYPIGSIYMSINSTNPGTLFGGTWERIKDTFLLASGDTYANGTTGGEATHTLTVNEMPSHNHSFKGNANVQVHDGSGTTKWPVFYNASSTQAYLNNTGGGQAHNNMPPYLAVYVWKRVS